MPPSSPFAVVQHLVHLHRRRAHRLVALAAEIEAALERGDVAFHRLQLRAGILLELRQAAGMIEVGMAVEQEFESDDLEAELGDVGLDLRHGLGNGAIEQDVPLRRRRTGRRPAPPFRHNRHCR